MLKLIELKKQQTMTEKYYKTNLMKVSYKNIKRREGREG